MLEGVDEDGLTEEDLEDPFEWKKSGEDEQSMLEL